MRDPGSIPTGGNICRWIFLFSHSKASDANIGIIAILVHFEKNSNGTCLQGSMKKMKVIINEKSVLFTLICVLYNIKNIRQKRSTYYKRTKR